MSLEEAELLRRRAHAFLKNAQRLLREGEYDLAAFSLEQYCQLILKYKLLLKKGGYPRTHSLRRLIRELGEVEPQVLELVNNIAYLHYIARLEEAYIASRYLPIVYEEAEVKDLARFVEEVFRKYVEG
ncbi:HEPN domain-containing protein [Thermoproteus tenax]|uniref:HEPN domain n=1 Tax=Thermoproteus tenax (strain ATCC 35583 / DSM 2078 / JCM 9277 / NBRC 100435 / Kra 1) TaxID=768679 RepID=G4RKB1_THETK|nr:HEPN domain-containing protein [Thermoproteus tenax]CCC82006.1 HEPN domain [Thermoproteus tenax Kra 1]